MTRKQIHSSFFGSESTDSDSGEMLTLSNVAALPDSQRQILVWMMGQGEVRLKEVASHVGLDEETVFEQINQLIQSGFVQESNIAGKSYYRTRSATSGDLTSQNFWQVPVPGSPLAAIANPSGDYAVKSGSTFDLSVTVSNQGDQNAVIDVFIDEASQPVRQWCASPNERIALGPNSSSEVSFQFQIPVQTLPGIYEYMLVVDAPQHYPEASPVQQAQRLQVLPKAQDVEQIADPTFSLQPATNSTNPATLQPGEALKIQVSVHNRSDHVDQFRLTCPDLDRNWFTVRYPEGLETLGLVIQANGLALNPDGKGELLLELHPPADTPAGRYFPSIRLYSDNQPDLVLMDVVYLQIVPTYPLTVEFRTILGRVRHQAGQYEIGLTNQGNIERELLLSSHADDEEFCIYTLTPEQVVLLPGDAAIIDLRVKPTKRWRRPFFKKRLCNFVVTLEDTQQLPLSKAQQSGQLVWEPRPWWQLLLILLCSLGTVAAIAFLVWWLFFKPLAPSQILEFGSESNVYAAGSGDAIRLKWRIHNPQQIQRLEIDQVSTGVLSEPRTFDFSQGIPGELKNLCDLQAEELVCQHVSTDARKVGNYTFELKVFPAHKFLFGGASTASSSKTGSIQILPGVLPKIAEFNSTPSVQAAANSDFKLILHNWKIVNPNKIQELQLIGHAPDNSVNSRLQRYDFSQGIPKELQKLCKISQELVCQDVPTQVVGSGSYIFELSTIPKQGQGEASDTKKANPIKIEPPQSKISLQIDGKEAADKYPVIIDQKYAVTSLTISWKVEGGTGSKVELLPIPGDVSPQGSISYPIVQKPGSETITLQVTDAAGQKTSRAVTIERVDTASSQTPTSDRQLILVKPSAPTPSKAGSSTVLTIPQPATPIQPPVTIIQNRPPVPPVPATAPTPTPTPTPSPTPSPTSTPSTATGTPSASPTDLSSPSDPTPSEAPPQAQ